ncbi:glycerol-3-phosphate dehydrogenase [Longilinea arvoryzae]|uniref:Glycerol-3-phosphate dehydrogenase n=1 Tax=Longilinea arvoryzae TaxID=360412 RepID=A0A0S7BFL7_9CHLR|nr:glycerol-3-phosphate dehydrogenase/oxidase [Longilinea arvoryzae]GAP13379.1 glycerol-3-phosphate dehydrogenase [Longilinea arvoryzae]
MNPANDRDVIWNEISGPWDVLIVGGGIVGVGLLRESVRLGLKTLLVDAADFGSGTSSRSSKMVHGGLRYLSTGQVMLTMHSVRERQRLLREGEGLIEPIEFLLPSYTGDRTPGWMFGLGLAIYDTIALRWQHTHHSTSEMRDLIRGLNSHNLQGGYHFYDAQTDDARLVLRVLHEAVHAGGKALNYTRAESLLRDRAGRVCGVGLHDLFGQRSAEVTAGVVINATGAWADELRKEAGQGPRLRRLRGSHLVFPRRCLPIDQVVSFLHPRDDRPVFALPWEGVTLIGTTDVDHRDAMSTDPAISPDEVDYLMEGLNFIFDSPGLTPQDAVSTFSGIRSVLDTGRDNPSRESRDEVLWNENGLITITGGKLTLFRHMAQDTLRFVSKQLPDRPRPDASARMLDEMDQAAFDLAMEVQGGGLDEDAKLRLLGRFGVHSADLLRAAQPGELTPVAGTPTLWAELRWAVRSEQVVHLEDLLLRRTRLGLLLPDGGAELLPRVRELCLEELGWDEGRWQAEQIAYHNLCQRAYSLPQETRVPIEAMV